MPAHREAVVVLEVVNAPRGECLGVLLLPVQGSGILRARHLAGAGVHSEQQAHVVNLVGYRLHSTGELVLVREELAIGASTSGPAVIKNNVLVAHVAQAKVQQLLGSIEQQIFRDATPEGIPIVLRRIGEQA